MIETPQIVRSERQPLAIIRLTVPGGEMPNVMGPAIGEAIATAQAQGIGPAGPVVDHYLSIEGGIFDFEVGVPVTGPVTPVGRVHASELPAAKVARTVYHGPYEGLGDAWGDFDAWLAANNYRGGRDLWQRYLVGPETSGNPADWRTELNRPLER